MTDTRPMKKTGSLILFSLLISTTLFSQDLPDGFRNPPMQYRPYAWWHWMGPITNYMSIKNDLEAMKDEGLGGATILNITSEVRESARPMPNVWWPWQGYRSATYWETLTFACAEARRLGLDLGLHNTPGYSTLGGPWIDSEDKGMQHLVSRDTTVSGGGRVSIRLEVPFLPPYTNWGAVGQTVPEEYHDIAYIAVGESGESKDISGFADNEGNICWNAPEGKWRIFRMGYACTMARPHPVPDNIIGEAMEVGKLDRELVNYHWDNVLGPLKERLNDRIGYGLGHLLVDSYECGDQNWSKTFREDFIRLKGYDPVPWLPFAVCPELDAPLADRFRHDFKDAVAILYQENAWDLSKERVNQAGMKLCQEPYWGPFSTVAGAASADIPMGEFWTFDSNHVDPDVPAGARAGGKTLIGAEAFTGMPGDSRFTEDPAFLRKYAERAFAAGINRLYLHQWVLQWYDDDSYRWKPGLTMGWWGTHFGKYQTWFEPAKAFFRYLSRTQYLLRQGEQVIDFLCLDKPADGISDAIATMDFLSGDISVRDGRIVLPSGRTYALMEFGTSEAMLPEVLDKLGMLVEQGAVVTAVKPVSSPSLSGYPGCDKAVAEKADALWARFAGKRIFASREEAVKALGLEPDWISDAAVVHRRSGDTDIYYLANLSGEARTVEASLRISGKLPELWNAENGSCGIVRSWHEENGRTKVSIRLEPWQSRFVVMRKAPTAAEIAEGLAPRQEPVLLASAEASPVWEVGFRPAYEEAPFTVRMNGLQDFSLSDDERVKYFSGTAGYKGSFNLGKKTAATVLDLGEVNDIAILKVNGKCVDTLWCEPYRRDVSDFVKRGRNTVEVEVSVNWANRMIGDERFPADYERADDRGEKGYGPDSFPDFFKGGDDRPEPRRKSFAMWSYWREGDQPLKAGLAGPVRVLSYSGPAE